MPNYDIEIPANVYNPAYLEFLDAPDAIQILFGSASSGKSVFIAQRIIRDVLNGGRNFLICRAVARTLRTSSFNEINKIINRYNLRNFFKINQSDMTVTCKNGNQILFGGLDDPDKVKSITPKKGVLTDIWIEEATEIKRGAFLQLKRRLRGLSGGLSKRITLSFNPVLKNHWIYKTFFSSVWSDSDSTYSAKGLRIKKFTYKDNNFLEKSDIESLESETDKYMYDVYTLGLWGVIGDVIFRNWVIEDLSSYQDVFDEYHNGLDFGFSNPSAIIRCAYVPGKNELLILAEAGGAGMTNKELADVASDLVGQETVFCDCAEPKSIRELQEHGLSAVPVKKGKDSLGHGIQWLQQQKIRVHRGCNELINELQLYHYKENKHGEKEKNPVKANDHFIDALRYATERIKLSSGSTFKIERVG